MSRRSSRRISTIPQYEEEDVTVTTDTEVTVQPTKSPKNGRKSKVTEQVLTSVQQVASSESQTSKQVSIKSTETIAKLKKSPAKSKVKTEAVESDHAAIASIDSASPSKNTSKKRKVKVEEDVNEDREDTKVKKKRKTKEDKEAEAMPLAARTSISTLKKAMYIGAHVSAAGGVHNSINNALHIGGNSFALFLKSQRKWTSPPMARDAKDQFHASSKEHKYDVSKYVLPHGSYLVNLAAADPEKAEQAYSCFLDDLQRCEALGIKLYNFHPGNTNGLDRSGALARIAENLNKAHRATEFVVTLLENMAGQGNTIGSKFEDLRDIIALVDDKSRVGVCIDTCHSFAAGYDLRTPEAFKKTMDSFDSIVGNQYLKALHLNDSKAPFASHRDLHANIGTGFLGLRAFHNVMNCELFQNMPMVLETPIDKKGEDGKTFEDKSVWATEIKLLEGLIGADAESKTFVMEEERLYELGAEERKKFQAQADKKVQKTLDGMFKKAGKETKTKHKDEDGSETEGGCNH